VTDPQAPQQLFVCTHYPRPITILLPFTAGFCLRSSNVCGLDSSLTLLLFLTIRRPPRSTPTPLGAWLGVASQGFADFESIHARRFRRGVQQVDRQVPLESGVLPITPRGSVLCLRPLASEPGRESFYPEPQARSIQTPNPVCREPLAFLNASASSCT